MEIIKKSEAFKFLRKRGHNAAVQIGFDGPYVFVEKADLIEQLKGHGRADVFSNYDGDEMPVEAVRSILYIPIGIS